jgi:dihydrodipicolinate synthase/N-acetylneuraminate lyase
MTKKPRPRITPAEAHKMYRLACKIGRVEAAKEIGMSYNQLMTVLKRNGLWSTVR